MIDSDYNYKELALYKELESRDSKFIDNIDDLYESVKVILNSRIPVIFKNYTMHDTGHCFRIIKYMAEIITDLSKLSELEIVMLIYSAFLHDIGMAVEQEDVDRIKKDEFDFADVKLSMVKQVNGYDDDTAMQEFVRRIHSQLSSRYIKNRRELFALPKPNSPVLNFAKELALICESHTEDIDWLKRNLTTHEVRGASYFNPQFIAGILRLADILDIDSQRTPYELYKTIRPTGISDKEWKQHFIISNDDKIEINPKTTQKHIVFYGSSDNPVIHRKLLGYLDWVRAELKGVLQLVDNMPSSYSLNFEAKVINNIQTIGFTHSDYKMSLDFKAISALLMGEKIYGDKTLGLRELVQNSMDACRLKKENRKTREVFGEEEYRPFVKIILNKIGNSVTIKDNGLGMSLEVIKKHFLNIGVSYYNSNEFKLRDFKYKPIGNFGIGFLSGFMLSSEVKVVTRAENSEFKYIIDLEKGSEYTSLANERDLTFEGTEVILKYNQFMGLFGNNKKRVESFLQLYFLTDGIEFTVVDVDGKDKETVANLLDDPAPLEDGHIKIQFQDHLREIEGYALIKQKRNFIKSFSDLIFEGNLYFYDAEENKLSPIEKSVPFQIDDYIDGRELKYLAVPLVPYGKEDKYMNGLDYTGDNVEEVISTFSHELDWISIVAPKEVLEFADDRDIWDDDNIIGDLSFFVLKELGHSTDCKTRVFVRTLDLYEGRKNSLYMPFENSKLSDYMFYRNREEAKKLFIRNVLIKDFSYVLPTMANVFEIKKIVVNVLSRDFIPDIARNNLDDQAIKLLGFIIGKAIHQGVLACDFLDADEKETLWKFNEAYYAEETPFEMPDAGGIR